MTHNTHTRHNTHTHLTQNTQTCTDRNTPSILWNLEKEEEKDKRGKRKEEEKKDRGEEEEEKRRTREFWRKILKEEDGYRCRRDLDVGGGGN